MVSGAAPARAVPVLARYHAPLLAAARFAGSALICGGADPGRRNLTNPLIRRAGRRGGLPRLDTSRLRATWLRDCAELLGLATFMHAAGISCSQRLGDLVAGLEPAGEAAAVRLLGAARRHDPAGGVRGDHRRLRRRAADRGHAARRRAPRQLTVRTLLAGMCLAQADHRPAHLTRVHQALVSLPEDDQRRLGVIADWKYGPHLLTYRQTERTFGLAADAPGKDEPDGLPSGRLQDICDDLLEASIPEEFNDASTSLAVDWTDLESFSGPRPPGAGTAPTRSLVGTPQEQPVRSEDELFYGYYASAAIMMPEENGPPVPEIARRATVSSCRTTRSAPSSPR